MCILFLLIKVQQKIISDNGGRGQVGRKWANFGFLADKGGREGLVPPTIFGSVICEQPLNVTAIITDYRWFQNPIVQSLSIRGSVW